MRRLGLVVAFVFALGALIAQEPVPTYGPGEPTDHPRDADDISHCSPVSKTKPCGQKEPCKECHNKGERGSEYVGERMTGEGKYYCVERCHKDHCACPDPCAQLTFNGVEKGCHPKQVE